MKFYAHEIQVPESLLHALTDICDNTPTDEDGRRILQAMVYVWTDAQGCPGHMGTFVAGMRTYLREELPRLRVVSALKEAGAVGDLNSLAKQLVAADNGEVEKLMRHVPGVVPVLRALGRLE